MFLWFVQVLDEIGINMAAELVDAPTAAHAAPAPVAHAAQPAAMAGGGGDPSMDDLAQRLNNLRK